MIFTIENDYLHVTIDDFGAEIQSVNRKDLTISYMWHGDKTYWGRRSPLLFPIVGRLNNNCYTYNNKQYQLLQHGFARDKQFQCVNQTRDSVTFELQYDEETLAVYPFEFKLVCTYTLINTTLKVWYDIYNLNATNNMYYSIGAHPAFSTQLTGDSFENYTVTFNGLGEFERYMLDNAQLVNVPVERVSNPHMQLERGWFEVDTIIYKTDLQQVYVDVYNDKQHGVRVAFQNVPYVAVWSPYTNDAPFVCIEPWQGICDTIEHDGHLIEKEGIQQLLPNSSHYFTYDMTFF